MCVARPGGGLQRTDTYYANRQLVLFCSHMCLLKTKKMTWCVHVLTGCHLIAQLIYCTSVIMQSNGGMPDAHNLIHMHTAGFYNLATDLVTTFIQDSSFMKHLFGTACFVMGSQVRGGGVLDSGVGLPKTDVKVTPRLPKVLLTP